MPKPTHHVRTNDGLLDCLSTLKLLLLGNIAHKNCTLSLRHGFSCYWLSNLKPNHDDLPFPLSLRAKVLNSGSLWFFYAIWCGYGHHFLLAISAMFCKMLQFRPRFRLNLVCNVVACRAQIIFRPLLILKINKVVINYRIKNNRLAIFLL